MQDRSRRRNDLILDAVAHLLETVNIEDLSHSDVAEAGGMSKASVHYHYPTIAAIQLQLGRRYDAELSECLGSSPRRPDPATWQEYIRNEASAARDWFNAHRPACEALLGPMLTRENRLAGIQYNTKVGLALLEGLKRRFQLPDLPGLERVVSMNGELMDLFWSRSYLSLGRIDDEALEESVRASIGYLRNFIPEYLPKRVRSQGPLEDAPADMGS